MSKQKLANVQALRAFASLWVVLFHAAPAVDPKIPSLNLVVDLGVLRRGYVGVDLFFVISGFVIAWVTMLHTSAAENPARFLVKRFFRLAPVYWLVASFFSLFFNRQESVTFASTFGFFPFDRVAPYFGFPALYVGWSLNYEVAFYLISAACLFAGRFAIPAALSTILCFTLALPYMRLGFIDLNPAIAYPFGHLYLAMISNGLMLEFAFGILVALAYTLLKGKVSAVLARTLFVVALIVYVWFSILRGAWFSAFVHGLPAALLLLAFLIAEDARIFVAPQWAVRIGELSFGIYLIHPVIIEALRHFLSPVPTEHWHYEVVRVVFIVGLTILLSRGLYKYIEQPCIEFGRNFADFIERFFLRAAIVVNSLKRQILR